jgi:hypothetical protein
MLVAANVQARVGERTTVCASPGLESGSPDACDGLSKPGTLTSHRRVVFKLFCLESPGETCKGMVEVSSMTGKKNIKPNKRFLYSAAAGTGGKEVSFGLSRRQVKVLGDGITMGVHIYAYEPDGRLDCSSSEELFVKKARKKKAKTAASPSLPTPDEKCIA